MYQSVEEQVMAILDEYKEIPAEVAERNARKTGRDTVQQLKNVSPKRPGGGEYASGWATKKQGKGVVVYNRKAPGLTHLLEKGHVIKNKYGTYGRAPAHVHIAPVEERSNREYVENVRRELSR